MLVQFLLSSEPPWYRQKLNTMNIRHFIKCPLCSKNRLHTYLESISPNLPIVYWQIAFLFFLYFTLVCTWPAFFVNDILIYFYTIFGLLEIRIRFRFKHLSGYQLLNVLIRLQCQVGQLAGRKSLITEIRNSIRPQYLECFGLVMLNMPCSIKLVALKIEVCNVWLVDVFHSFEPCHLNFREWLSPASKSRYGWNTAKAT